MSVIVVALTVLLADAWSGLGTSAEGFRLQRMQASPQHGAKAFLNKIPAQTPQMGAFLSKWWNGNAQRTPTDSVPVQVRATNEFFQEAPSGLRITWFGHSSMLIEMDGHRFLTDPIWGERCSPSSWLGPKRFFAPVMPIEALPPIDAVVFSHDHYDHLDEFTVRELEKRKPSYVAPLGVGAHLEYWGVEASRITELDWWEKTQVGKVELVATPARHFSGRGLMDRNATLWASWSFLGPTHRVYFSGDTGMHPEFDLIGQRYGPFDVTLMESGAYDSLWADFHMGPEQAVRAHQLLRGRFLMPIHWGTFNLALHAWTEPAERLVQAAQKAQVAVYVPKPGESVEPANRPTLARWWPQVPWRTAEEAPVVSTGLEGTVAATVTPPSLP